MPLDGLVTSSIVSELNNELINGKIEKVYQPEKDEIIIAIRAKGKNRKLLLSANSSFPRAHLFTGQRVNPPSPPNFCMLLRKYIQGGRIVSIDQSNFERIINIHMALKSELGEPLNWRLVIEIMGKHSNIILVDNENNKIIDAIKKVSFDISRLRQILPNTTYQLPPDQDKVSPINIEYETFCQSISKHHDEIFKSIYKSLQGVSPFIAREICHISQIDELSLFENLTELDKKRLYDSLKEVINQITNTQHTPCIYHNHEQVVKDFYCFDVKYMEEMYLKKSDASISTTIEAFYASKDLHIRLNQKSSDLQKLVTGKINKLQLKKQKLLEDLLKAESSDTYRIFGDLINANLYRITPKSKEITLENYYDDNQMVRITLDPRLSASQNAQKYFKRYNKSKTALVQKQIQLDETEIELAYFHSVMASVDHIESVVDIDEIRNELVSQGYAKKKITKEKQKKKKTVFLTYQSSDGFNITVGKNNLQNDELTTKLASKKDLWFHTKEIHGSHVIVESKGVEIPEQTIIEAAQLAAYYSKGKMSENVPVDYTIVKNVKKPSGSKPGMVIYDHYNTIYVSPKLIKS